VRDELDVLLDRVTVTHLADAKAKLRALATFADTHDDQFVRIEYIVEVGGDVRSLDLLSEKVRTAIADHTEAGATTRGGKAV
jgi:hypothetical protein